MEVVADPKRVREDTAVIDVAPREIIRGGGADRIVFLHRLLTGNVAGTPVGGGTRTLLLDTKGHVVGDMFLFVLQEEVRLAVPAGEGGTLAAALGRYAIMDDFTAAVDGEAGMVALAGPRTFERLAAAGLPSMPTGAPWSHATLPLEGTPVFVVRARLLAQEGAWLFAPAAARQVLLERLAALGVARLAPDIAEALRIAAGEPQSGREITVDHFPMEVGLDQAIDYTKGCYLGQEPIVRIRDRGHINWRLVRLAVRGDVVPAAGDTLESDVKPRAGRVTSAGRLPGEPPLALALLHVSVPVGAEVRIKHGEATVAAEVLPPGA